MAHYSGLVSPMSLVSTRSNSLSSKVRLGIVYEVELAETSG